MQIGPFTIHRKAQDDLDATPIVCVHVALPAPRVGSQRVFCLWTGGVQIGGRVTTTRDLVRRALRPQFNSFAKEVVSQAKQRGIITNDTLHELAGIIDRKLWPEHYRKVHGPFYGTTTQSAAN